MKFNTMKAKSITLFALISALPLSALAASSTQSDEEMVNALSARTQKLDQQIISLRHQINQLNSQQSPKKTKKKVTKKRKTNNSATRNSSSLSLIHAVPLSDAPNASTRIKLTRLSGVNLDSKILQQRKASEIKIEKAKLPFTENPSIEIGGAIIGSASAKRDYTGEKSSDLNLTGASLDLVAEINPWLTAVAQLSYSSGGSVRSTGTTMRVANSQIILSKGFITLGRFTQSPFYASLGQMTVPFGDYVSYTGTPPLTARIGRILQRALVVGYRSPTATGLYGSVFTFKGDTRTNDNSNINNGGVNLGYTFSNKTSSFDTGISYVANIADSGGMQNTSAPFIGLVDYDNEAESDDEEGGGTIISTFHGFGSSAATEYLEHRVPAIDVHAKATLKQFLIAAGYTSALTSFDPDNLSYNFQGAKPAAYNLEVGYKLSVFGYQSQIGIGYSHSKEALALYMPKDSYHLGFQTRVLKNLTAGLSFKHDINYGTEDYATGQLMPIANYDDLGKSSNLLMARVGVSF